MKRLLCAISIAILGMLWPSVTPAGACSPGPDFDPMAQSEVIVGGRVTGWRLVENVRRWDAKSSEPEPTGDPNYWGSGGFDPIALSMSVDRVYKGHSPTEVEMFSGNTLDVATGGGGISYRWIGSSGACGAFDSDPTGGYFILGLFRDEFGRLHPSLPLMFYFGSQPPSDTGSTLDARLEGLSAWSLPTGGGPPGTGSVDWNAAVILLGAAGVSALLLAGAAFSWRRGESHSE